MSSPALTARVTRALTEAARLMHRRHVKRLPVVDDQGRLVGIGSRANLLQAFTRNDDSIAWEVPDDVILGTLVIDPDHANGCRGRGGAAGGEVEARSSPSRCAPKTVSRRQRG